MLGRKGKREKPGHRLEFKQEEIIDFCRIKSERFPFGGRYDKSSSFGLCSSRFIDDAVKPLQRVLALVIGAAVCVISLLLAPFARVQLSEMQAYQPAVLSAVICFELITAYVLYSQFRVNRMPSVLMLSAGYLFSGRHGADVFADVPRRLRQIGSVSCRAADGAMDLFVLAHGTSARYFLIYVVRNEI